MRNIDDFVKTLPKHRRDKVERAASEKIAALRLQQAREHAGISQEELAKRMDMSQPALSRVEHRADVRISTIVRYIEAMGGGVEITALLPAGKGKPHKRIKLFTGPP